MAKLNVVIPNAEVTVRVDGGETVTYRKVDREAEVGDVIRFDDESDYVTRGGYYEVVRIDSEGDPQILDNDGDEFDLCGDDYEVYEKVMAAETKEPESDELFTYEGPDGTSVQYRKVKRKAAVGERVLIVNASDTFGKYRNGDVLTVDEEAMSTDGIRVISIRVSGNSTGYVRNEEYVVLEPVKSAEPPKPTIKIGDTVKLTIADGNSPKHGWGEVENGEIGTVRYVGKSSVRVDFPSQKNWNAAPGELTVLSEADVKAEAERVKWAAIGREVGEFKAGDVVEIVRYQCGDPVGTITEIVSSSDSGIGHQVKTFKLSYGMTYGADSEAIKLLVPVEQRFDRTEAVS